jgi:hypothetical protein
MPNRRFRKRNEKTSWLRNAEFEGKAWEKCWATEIKEKKVQVWAWDWIFCWVFGVVGIYFFASFLRKIKNIQ